VGLVVSEAFSWKILPFISLVIKILYIFTKCSVHSCYVLITISIDSFDLFHNHRSS
jgi:hypothetical protein